MLNRVQLDLNIVSSSLVSAYLGEEIGKETAAMAGGTGGTGTRKREGARYALTRAAGVLRAAERRSKSGLERVEFRECSNWIRETEGKAASGQGAGRREETRNRRMALTKCDIHFSPGIIRFAVGGS